MNKLLYVSGLFLALVSAACSSGLDAPAQQESMSLNDIPIHPDLEPYHGLFRDEFVRANHWSLAFGGLDRARQAGLSAKDLTSRDGEAGVYRYQPPPRPTRDPATPASSGWTDLKDIDPESIDLDYRPLNWWLLVDFYNTQLSKEDGWEQEAIDVQEISTTRISGTRCNSDAAAWINSHFENQLLMVSVVSSCSSFPREPAPLDLLFNRGTSFFTVAVYTFEPE